jgi:hypothetical protein
MASATAIRRPATELTGPSERLGLVRRQAPQGRQVNRKDTQQARRRAGHRLRV